VTFDPPIGDDHGHAWTSFSQERSRIPTGISALPTPLPYTSSSVVLNHLRSLYCRVKSRYVMFTRSSVTTLSTRGKTKGRYKVVFLSIRPRCRSQCHTRPSNPRMGSCFLVPGPQSASRSESRPPLICTSFAPHHTNLLSSYISSKKQSHTHPHFNLLSPFTLSTHHPLAYTTTVSSSLRSPLIRMVAD
jgi:hypothetical protein